MLKINEVFWSAQGEGLHSGTSSIFIRLAGCSLRCPYCDSRRAWRTGRSLETVAVLAEVIALKAIRPHVRVVITGGEPLEQNLKELVAALHRLRCRVALETNGLHFQDLHFNWWTVSPKDVSGYSVHPKLWAKADEIKLVVRPSLDLNVVKKMRSCTEAPIFLQPERRDRRRYPRTYAFYKTCCAAGIPDVRLGLQLHTIFRIP